MLGKKRQRNHSGAQPPRPHRSPSRLDTPHSRFTVLEIIAIAVRPRVVLLRSEFLQVLAFDPQQHAVRSRHRADWRPSLSSLHPATRPSFYSPRDI